MELFVDYAKTQLLKVYIFKTTREITYVLDCGQSEVYNYYHKLIKPRGLLQFVNIYQHSLLGKN